MRNILNIALYESRTLSRGWFFRIFAILSMLYLFGINMGMFANPGAMWSMRAIAANLPYINILFINVAQAIIAIFLASDFIRRDKKLDTTEVIYTRPITNGQYVVGKTLGVLFLFLALVLLALVMSLIINLIKQDVPVVWEAYVFYPVLITFPTLIFILGLSFFLMIVLRSQAVTFLILLAYIGVSVFYFRDKLFGILDYMSFFLPMTWSDFTGFGDFRMILLQRLAYFLAGIGFIFTTIRLLNRLPQTGRWNMLNVLAALAFLLAGGYSGYLFYSLHNDTTKDRARYLELNNQYEGTGLTDVISNDIEMVHRGHRLEVVSRIRLRNDSGGLLDTLVFSINPGLVIDSIVPGRGSLEYERKDQLLLLVPDNPLQNYRNMRLSFYYHGTPDPSVAYLDIPPDDFQIRKQMQIATVDKKPGFIEEGFVLLTPELLWYPVAGVGFNLKSFQSSSQDFTRFSLSVTCDEDMMPVSPGKRTEEEGKWLFAPEQDLSSFPLVIGPFEEKSIEVDGVEYSLFLKPEHDFFSPFFTELQDTLPALITEAKERYEIDELDLYYEFPRISLVEVPVHYHAYERPYKQQVDYIFPEMILMPEKGSGLSTLDFSRSRYRSQRGNRDEENQRTEEEIQSDLFKRFIEYTFFTTNLEMRSRGRRGENLITYNRGTDYMDNPYEVFPLYYSFVTGISSREYPIFNSMMELYLKEGYEMSPRQGFTGGITSNEEANLALQERSLVESFALWDNELTSSLINQAGGYIFSALRNRVGMGDFDYFLYYYLEDHAFQEIPFEQFARDFYQEFGVEVGSSLEIIESGGKMATILMSEPEYIQTRDDLGELYLVRFRITNKGTALGIVDVTFRIMSEGGFGGGGGGMDTEQRLFEVKAGETRDIQVVLYEQPRMVTVNTMISKNIPSSSNVFLRQPIEETTVKEMEEYNRITENEVSFVYEGEYVVDNEDEGFSSSAVSRESRLKQYLDARRPVEEEKFSTSSMMNTYWNPSRWHRVAHSAMYGETIRSAMVSRSGDGSNVATWTTELPETGFYDVWVYIPTSAMLKRPERGGGQSSGQGRGGGGSRGRGPEFADRGTEYHYILSSSEGEEEVVFRLDRPENGWNFLGSYHFPGETVSITLTNESNGSRVVADAVKWVWQP